MIAQLATQVEHEQKFQRENRKAKLTEVRKALKSVFESMDTPEQKALTAGASVRHPYKEWQKPSDMLTACSPLGNDEIDVGDCVQIIGENDGIYFLDQNENELLIEVPMDREPKGTVMKGAHRAESSVGVRFHEGDWERDVW